jgi:HAE1 family hydrophobic/amphiphilic exporter-1
LRERLRALRETNIGIADVAGVSSGGGKQSRPIQFNLRHKDPKVLAEAVQKVMAAMRKNPGFTDVDSTWRTGKPELDVQVDRSRAAALGVPAGLLGQQLRTLLGRDKLARFREGGETYDIRATLPAEVLADPMRLGALQVRSPTRQMLELRALANMRPGEGPSMIERQAMVRQVTVLADLRSYSLSEAMEFLEGVASRELPAGVQHGFDGQGGELGTALRGFLSAFVLGVLLLYIILAAQFESLVHPVAIMMALPFAVIGALGSLLLARQPMSIFAMIGIIMLMGLVAKNGILLVEFTNQLRNEGKTTREALLAAGPIRLRPILMTTVAMIAGMIPVALARGEGAVIRVPMGISVIGGLITSTVLTLGVVPVIYSLLDDMLGRAARLTARHAHPQRADSGPPSDLEPTVPAD